MTGKAEKRELAKSVGLKAIESFAKRECRGVSLDEGSRHLIDLTISGTVNGQEFSETVVGDLVVGMGSPTGSTKAPNARHLLCAAFEIMPKTRRERLIEALTKDGSVPKPDAETEAIVKSLFQSLSTKAPKAGAVSFQPDAS